MIHKNYSYNFFKHIKEKDWNDWRWQLRNSIVSIQKLNEYICLKEEEKETEFPFRITPYYLNVIGGDFNNPLRKSVVPSINESVVKEYEEKDPLDEDKYIKTQNIIHKYPDRVLFLTTTFCSVFCRFCTRSRCVGRYTNGILTYEESFKYLREHIEIKEVILSGGDFLTLEDTTIEFILRKISEINHIEIIRIGTKIPVVLPMRFTENLISILKKYKPIINIHFTHPKELTKETLEVLNKLADCGIILGSQTVLLKGINDDVITLKELFFNLLKNRCRPYYAYILDDVKGTDHFRVDLLTAKKIFKQLRLITSGMAVPQLIKDTKENKIIISPFD